MKPFLIPVSDSGLVSQRTQRAKSAAVFIGNRAQSAVFFNLRRAALETSFLTAD